MVFLGDGANRASLESYSKEVNSEISVKFEGRVSRDVAISYMLEADVLISLSKGEGMPISVLEAIYSGCFTILSDIPPHKEISPLENTCIFVSTTQNKEIVNALNYVDKNISSVRGEGVLSSEYVLKNYSLESMLGNYYNIYCELSRTNTKHLKKVKN